MATKTIINKTKKGLVQRIMGIDFNELPNLKSPVIEKAFLTCNSKVHSNVYNSILVSISGGADSDIMLDMFHKVVWMGQGDIISYVFFDTGIEYEATKVHLQDLEEKYGITIKRFKAYKPVPIACHQYGVPFLSKKVSMFISRLQKHGFQWEDKPYEELDEKYPKCQSALKWWCNKNGDNSSLILTMIMV